MKILFVAPARDYSHRLRKFQFAASGQPVTWSVPGLPNITVTSPPKFLPNSLSTGRRFNERLLRRHVRQAARRLGMRDAVLWLNPHSAVHMVGRMGEAGAIYDITDDWISFTQSPRQRALVARQDRELCKKADAVIVCSQKLYEMKQRLVPAERLHLIPNGVDAGHYAAVGEGSLPLPEAAKQWRRPVLGYTGTIHPDRVDVELIAAVAEEWGRGGAGGVEGGGSVVLVGPNHLTPAQRGRLALPNVYMTGPVPYREIPGYMSGFDVCITPHLVSAFTESLNPIKLWEYLAAGKPIVSTAVAGFRDFPEHVRIAEAAGGAKGFVAACREALAEPTGSAAARRREAQRHSWEARVDAIEAVIARVAARGSRETVLV